MQGACCLNVHPVTRGGDFCLDVRSWGMLEMWTAPLAGGAYAAVLWNRSPAPDLAAWSDLAAWGRGVAPGAAFDVHDVWAGADVGPATGSYTAAGVMRISDQSLWILIDISADHE